MSEYAKKTVAELTEILKGRSLPHSGKKADLIARLEEHDKASVPAESAEPVSVDLIPENVEAEPSEVDAPIAQSHEDAPAAYMEDTSTADVKKPDAATDAASGTDAQLAEAVDYSMGLVKSEADAELKKREERAKRFGLSTEEIDPEKEKALARAKKFGTATGDAVGVKGLDEALPEERRRKRGRGDDDGHRAGRGGRSKFARSSDRRGQGRDGGGSTQNGAGQKPTFCSDKDRQAAEARKKRFAAA